MAIGKKINTEAVNDYPPIRFEIWLERKFPIVGLYFLTLPGETLRNLCPVEKLFGMRMAGLCQFYWRSCVSTLSIPSSVYPVSNMFRPLCSQLLGRYRPLILTFDAHIRACSRACFYHLRRIGQIRPFIDDRSLRLSRHVWTTATDCLPTAAWLFVDGCNEFITAPLVWSAQNQPSATLHHSLHWLPVARRIKYK